MTLARIVGRFVRFAIAMAFGFMSLGHGPIMAFTHAAASHPTAAMASHHHDASAHAHSSHNAEADDCHETAMDGPAMCNAFGCFITVGVAAIDPPAQALRLIGKLPLPPSPVGVPALTAPADPPPRLHG